MAGTCSLKGPIKELLKILELNFSFPESHITDPSVNASIQQRTVLYKKSPVTWWDADNMRVTVQSQGTDGYSNQQIQSVLPHQ
jgi:hypothetical protein